MSVLSALGGREGPAKTVMAEMPVVLQPGPGHRQGKQKSPQEKLDRFWKRFTTEAPGKATAVIPQNKTTSKASKGRTNVVSSSGTTTTRSYEEAAALCRAKVDKIVKECRRINQKYRDPHFDLEFDLKMNRRDCLDPLDNAVREVEDSSSSDESVGRRRRHRHQHSRSQSRRRRRRRGHTGPLVDMDGAEAEGKGGGGKGLGKEGGDKAKKVVMPRDSDQRFLFSPKAVKRVGEIFDDPTFYIDGPSANDVRQGRDGDCWLMAALCTLSNKPGLIERICVARDEAVGVYGFVFHRDGEWISEIIDDKLYLTKPDYDEVNLERIMWEDRDRVNSEETYRKTYQANSGALYFAQCEHPNETWLPLLEKAYAKAHGDYAAIEGGFTGEGIEDLTGGVTSELFTTDILDKEYFWKEELMKVNEQFLFGCSTGVWGRGWGERKGIMELHAYSVMRAVEMDGERLLLLKNPWGKGEWNGAWSDGSKEWTPEWLKKLNHRFGDDGAFWISYDDLLRKYQAFDRTRLFGPDWKVTSIWTTLSVPWTLEYHDTKFAFTLAKPGPVVLVLSQLDDRYFRGLEGQYRFELSFRLHKAGEEDYVVRSQTTYRMNRSVNVELELEAGEYHVLVKIDATRDSSVLAAEDVVRANAREKREKLIRIGLAYDVAHSKGRIVESPEEKAAREGYEKWKRDKEKTELKERIMKDRARSHYIQVKRLAKNRRAMEKRRAKQKAKEEKARAEEERAIAQRGPPPPGMGMRPGGPPVVNVRVPGERRDGKGKKKGETPEEGKPAETKADAQVQTEEQRETNELPKEAETAVKDGDPQAEAGSKNNDAKDDSAKDGDSSVGHGENTPTSTNSEKSVDNDPKKDAPVPGPTASDQTEPVKSVSTATEDFAKGAVMDEAESERKQPEVEAESKPESKPESQTETNPPEPETSPAQEDKAKTTEPLKPGDLSQEETFHSANQDPTSSTSSSTYTSDSETSDATNDNPTHNPNPNAQHPIPPPRSRHPPPPHHRPGPPTMPPSGFRPPPPGYHPPPNAFVPRRMAVPMRGQPPPATPGGGGYASDNESLSSISSPSDISDRELEYHLEDQKSRTVRAPLPPPPGRGGLVSDSEDEVERDPWNAVAVVGFRVYYVAPGEGEGEEDEGEKGETVKIRVIRPVWFPVEKDGEAGKKKVVLEGAVKETGMDESMVLDLDDSAKDATLQGGEKMEVVEEGAEARGGDDGKKSEVKDTDVVKSEDDEKEENAKKDEKEENATKDEAKKEDVKEGDEKTGDVKAEADVAEDGETKNKVMAEEEVKCVESGQQA